MASFRIYLFLSLISAVGLDAVFAQESDSVIDEIKMAFSEGNTDRILALAPETLEIALLGESRKYSRSQATHVLRKFFGQNRPRRFEVRDFTRVQRGWFIKGTLHITSEGGPFLVYLRLSQFDDDWLLREILIERPRR